MNVTNVKSPMVKKGPRDLGFCVGEGREDERMEGVEFFFFCKRTSDKPERLNRPRIQEEDSVGVQPANCYCMYCSRLCAMMILQQPATRLCKKAEFIDIGN